ncbi:Thioredoxin reductase [Cnuella takakiae]|uniref:Thioredoxin reductase n=1 Tax=Cnuella takakiae TaxID=1302690 RepID=A0A1M4Z7Y3_9BACT|nr:NAD(P)/FAD-dependent oxidoreductase [Cnuella takakiae]OLY94307.1 pyridine nucleotide-disulfide oxidoreductase [Cnuella takakiae]SHF13897.1 Thioredoxin reductase [Cnuella takakiae]
MQTGKQYDVIIIGGSYAGLSAAMALGRSLKKVLIIDSGKPCNRQTPHSHNFITQDGEKPAVIAGKAKEQVLKYSTVSYIPDLALSGEKGENGFTITTQSGENFEARKLIFATGIKDTLPDIPGFAACWGTTIVHCPYCHGYELRNMKTGILANGERALHLAGLVHNLTKDLTVLTSGKAAWTQEQIAKLDQHRITIIETGVVEIIRNGAQIEAVLFSDGSKLQVDALYAAVPFTQHSGIPASLGCELTEQGHIKVDAFQQSTVPGVYACGDNAAMMRSVANAVYSGNVAGAMVNKELTDEQF